MNFLDENFLTLPLCNAKLSLSLFLGSETLLAPPPPHKICFASSKIPFNGNIVCLDAECAQNCFHNRIEKEVCKSQKKNNNNNNKINK